MRQVYVLVRVHAKLTVVGSGLLLVKVLLLQGVFHVIGDAAW
jgi:hypothetical protein